MATPLPPSPDWEPTKWLPLVWQTITTVIAVVAFFRTLKTTLPLAWVEQRGRGPNGAGVTLVVHNTTNRPVRVNHVRAKRSKVGPAPNAQMAWRDHLSVDKEIRPDEKFALDFSISLAESSSPTKERIKLSVSTMRWITRKRTMTMPIIIPRYVDKSQSNTSSVN
ncbi:hypothetical protein [Bosea rubneri]|uniref:Uncharacterized protein n=1 Tax=Bosea rubneri TaxID=3075434 RepID=A0ABU3SFY5_9HYPH|nr:hypothetical protein [Bosea sp. ZW T0_25]MDU0343708.1 hypothetical protein [Bosea sp. ZW T0_25]